MASCLEQNFFSPRAAEASRKKKENRRKWKRYLLIGLATVGGGTVIGRRGGTEGRVGREEDPHPSRRPSIRITSQIQL